MDSQTLVKSAIAEGAKATPPVAVLATNAASGWSMSTVATAMTIAYVLLQAAYLVWRWRNESRDRREKLNAAAGLAP